MTFLPRYLSLGYIGNDLIRVGVYQLPFGSGSNLGGIGIGFLFRYVKYQKWTLVGSVLLQVIFIGLLAVPGKQKLQFLRCIRAQYHIDKEKQVPATFRWQQLSYSSRGWELVGIY